MEPLLLNPSPDRVGSVPGQSRTGRACHIEINGGVIRPAHPGPGMPCHEDVAVRIDGNRVSREVHAYGHSAGFPDRQFRSSPRSTGIFLSNSCYAWRPIGLEEVNTNPALQ